MRLLKLGSGGLALAALLLPLRGPAQTKTTLGPAQIDHLIRAEWNKEGVIPAPPVDDARFLRRIYLDLTGTIPPPEVVTDFLADRSPSKRARAVEMLLDSARYADNWTNYWDGILMGKQVRAAVVDRAAFRGWLHTQFEKNTPWNKFVYDLVTATGQNSTGGSYAKAAGLMMTPNDMAMEQQTTPDEKANVNGAVNWVLKYAQAPADLSGTVSKIFLGVQIQCAQCHDHKTEKWKQEDFRRFTACFIQTRPVPVDRGQQQKGMMRRVEIRDIPRPLFPGRGKAAQKLNAGRNEYVNAIPAAFDGTDFSDSPNRRQALAAWITAPENPYFAPALVNRLWARFLGRGFVEPIDDFRPSNPTVMPELLKQLSDDFVANGYDLKRLIRTICATQVYQLSSGTAKQTDPGNTLWARYRLKPMTPDEMVDSLVQATNIQPVLERVAGARLPAIKFGIQRQFTFLFDVDEESEQKEFVGTIPQTLLLLNGNLVNNGTSAIPGTALADTLALPGGDERKIEALYLRTVSRKPTAAEMKKWVAFVNAPREVVESETLNRPAPMLGRFAEKLQGNPQLKNKAVRRGGGGDPLPRLEGRMRLPAPTPKQQAYEDLFWALLNSSEFIFNH